MKPQIHGLLQKVPSMSLKVERAEAAFRAMGKQYHARKKAAESLVVRWVWSKRYLFSIQPMHAETSDCSYGRPLAKAPTQKKDHFETGYDEAGRVVVERQYAERGRYETFYDWSADPIEVAHYNYDSAKEPINMLHAYVRKDGCIVETYMAARYGFAKKKYVWLDGLVRTIEYSHADRTGNKLAKIKRELDYMLTYKANGSVAKVVSRERQG